MSDNKHIIYMDNAATSKLSDAAFSAMLPFLKDNYGNPSQPYAFSRIAKKAIEEARATIAYSIGAKYAEEVYFTSCGTESNNWVIKSFAKQNPKSTILSTPIEHHSVLNALNAVDNDLSFLPINAHGVVDLDKIDKVTLPHNSLASVMMANNEIGSIQPIYELSRFAHLNESFIHTDAVQAVGHIDINVQSLEVDFLSASAHKFNGPKGIGFLYIKKGNKLCPYIDGGSQESMMRAGTENVAYIVAMAAALKENILLLEDTQKKISELESRLMAKLSDSNIDFIRNGDFNHTPGNISLSFRDCDGEAILHRLDLCGVMVSTGSACDSKETQISHVLRAINLPLSYAHGTIRISLCKDNTPDEVDYLVDKLIQIVK